MEENKPAGLKESKNTIKFLFGYGGSREETPIVLRVNLPDNFPVKEWDWGGRLCGIAGDCSDVGEEAPGSPEWYDAVVDPQLICRQWVNRMNQLVDMVLVNKDQRESAKEFIKQASREFYNEARESAGRVFNDFHNGGAWVRSYEV